MDPAPSLFGSGFEDANENITFKLFSILIAVGTLITLVFKENMP
jgi:hypothetical protein